MELKLLCSVRKVEGVVRILDFFERDDSFVYILDASQTVTVNANSVINNHETFLTQFYFMNIFLYNSFHKRS